MYRPSRTNPLFFLFWAPSPMDVIRPAPDGPHSFNFLEPGRTSPGRTRGLVVETRPPKRLSPALHFPHFHSSTTVLDSLLGPPYLSNEISFFEDRSRLTLRLSELHPESESYHYHDNDLDLCDWFSCSCTVLPPPRSIRTRKT